MTSSTVSTSVATTTVTYAVGGEHRTLKDIHGMDDDVSRVLSLLDSMDVEKKPRSLDLLQLLLNADDIFLSSTRVSSTQAVAHVKDPVTQAAGPSVTSPAAASASATAATRLVFYDSREKIKFRRFSGNSPVPNGEVSFAL